MPRSARPLVVLALASLLSGCSGTVEWVGIRLFYDAVPAGSVQVLEDLPYRDGSTSERHLLDLYLPAGDGWPSLVFVHGGGWTSGDKGLVVGGADVYGNIGRFFAAHGIATAVINYRLQPEVTWREQVDDVSHAVAWLRREAAERGGDPAALFLAGHSAGAQLAAYVGLDARLLSGLGLPADALCGVVPVSGAGYDLADEETYRLGAHPEYYEERFRAGDPGDSWQREASAISWITPQAPPFLLIHGSREWKSLQHQNRLLDDALRQAGAESRRLVATQSHQSIVLALSRPDKLPGAAILDFVRQSSCAGAAARPSPRGVPHTAAFTAIAVVAFASPPPDPPLAARAPGLAAAPTPACVSRRRSCCAARMPLDNADSCTAGGRARCGDGRRALRPAASAPRSARPESDEGRSARRAPAPLVARRPGSS